jgi:hypothetical protein
LRQRRTHWGTMSGINDSANDPYVSEQTHQQLSKSEIFGVLQNDRRRCVLEILHNKGKQSIRSLSNEIACLESGDEEPKSSFRKSIYVSLLQTHIPKMESLKLITYNREEDNVELLPASHDFDIYVETVKKGDISWSQFYLGLSMFAVVGNLTIFTGLIKWITSSQWMLFTSAIFIVSSLAHMHYIQKREK